MSAMQRTKGAGYEREVCGELFQELGVRDLISKWSKEKSEHERNV